MTKEELKNGLNYHLTKIEINLDKKVYFDEEIFNEILEKKEIILYGDNGQFQVSISEDNGDYEIEYLNYSYYPENEYSIGDNDNFLDFDKDWLVELHNENLETLKRYFTDKEIEKLLKDKEWNNKLIKDNKEYEVYINWKNGYIVDLPYDIDIKILKGW